MITHPDKIYWPKERITKGELIDYYVSMAKYILPHLKDKPESLKRFPEGVRGEKFFQKNITDAPAWLKTVRIEHKEKTINYLLIQDLDSLIYTVNLGCIELNPWLSTYKHQDYPEFLVLDLDPENISFDKVVETALVIHEVLEEVGIKGYCKTSGATGMHICIPLRHAYDYDQVRQLAELLAILAHERAPGFTSLVRSPKGRQKKVYIDFLQNSKGQTITAPYSARPFPGASVSTPLEWKEVKVGIHPSDFTIFNTLKRVEKKGDLYKPLLSEKTPLGVALKKIEKRFG